MQVEPSVELPRRLIVWAITRGRSTALERAFMQRTDTVVTHEEFTAPGGRRHPDARSVIGELLNWPLNGKISHVSKEMSSFAPLHIPEDELRPWLRQFRHAILVRRPLHSLASLKRVGTQDSSGQTYFDPDTEAGFKEAFWLRHRLADACGADEVPVIDADDHLLSSPRETLGILCEMAGLEFQESMLSWEGRDVPEWSKLEGWHEDAKNSKGFEAPGKSDDYLDDPEVLEAARVCDPFYQALRRPFDSDVYLLPEMQLTG